MTITRALGSTFIVILLLTAALVYNAASSLRDVADNSALVASDWMPRLLNSRELEAQFLELRVGYLTHMTSLTDASMTQAETLIDAQRKDFERSVQGLQQSVQSFEDDANLLKKIEASYAQYVAQSEELISMSRSNNKEDAVKVLDQMTEKAVPLLEDIRTLISHNLAGAHSSIDQGLATYSAAMQRNFLVGGSVGLIIVLSTFYVVFGMARPIRVLRTTIIALAEGKNDVVIPYSKRRGEVGEIANSVEVFRQAAIENERLQVTAREQRDHADAEREHVHAQAERFAQEKLDDARFHLADGLRKLAMGHLDIELSEHFAPEFEGLRHDLNSSAQQLSRTLIAVSNATGNIDAGLRQIDAGAVNLADRTEIQALSLKNTVASINQITQTVEAATKRLMTARSLVSTATERAHNSETVVTAAVNAMRGIEKSSSRISMIIGVIDEISFQTNLLALNAGVEAARAGEAGNGFAVVASEVRELARRSATAAREIKELIASSKSDVATGVALVEQTGKALAEIQESVGMIDNHMDAVTASAAEQANELNFIDRSIRDLDTLTRNNVDLVAATKRETTFLSNESAMLQQILSGFKLPSNASSKHAA